MRRQNATTDRLYSYWLPTRGISLPDMFASVGVREACRSGESGTDNKYLLDLSQNIYHHDIEHLYLYSLAVYSCFISVVLL